MENIRQLHNFTKNKGCRHVNSPKKQEKSKAYPLFHENQEKTQCRCRISPKIKKPMHNFTKNREPDA
jgi:hypothetical protein